MDVDPWVSNQGGDSVAEQLLLGHAMVPTSTCIMVDLRDGLVPWRPGARSWAGRRSGALAAGH
jgi:hypothetical protein